MTSFFIVGNCHLNGLLRTTRFLAPGANVAGCALWDLAGRFPDRAAFLAHLDGFDTVFTQRFDRGSWPEAGSDDIVAHHRNVVVYPTINFPAFHPDVVHLFRQPFTGEFLPSPLGPFQSGLACYGFRRGYGVARTVDLFREDVFARLGYFSAWQASVDALLEPPEARDFDFATLVVSWARQGCFMHNPQHPKLGPITDIAATMLRRTGFASPHARPADHVTDDLVTGHIWPLYPEIAARYGLAGTTYSFKRDAAAAPTPASTPEVMTLPEFVAASFENFAAHDLPAFSCERVDRWLAEGLEL